MQSVWAICLLLALLAFAGIALELLLRPSASLRYFRNPWQPDTVENRVYVRGLGLILCLFILMMLSGAGTTATSEGFHRNMVVVLSASFLIVPIFLWILWQFSPPQKVIRRQLTGEVTGDARWELWMSLAFSGLLSALVLIAFLLARKGYYPRWPSN